MSSEPMNAVRTPEDVIALIAAKAKECGSDDFRIKVERRPTVGAAPRSIATFDGARVDHFSTPETWIPRFCGGGIYQLKAFHAADPNTLIGMPAYQIEGQPKDPDITAVKRSDWKGPSVLIYPEPKDLENPMPQIAAPFSGNGTGGTGKSSGGAVGEGSHPELERERNQLAMHAENIRKQELDLAERRKQLEIEAIKREAAEARRSSEERIKDLERRIEHSTQAAIQPSGQSDAMVELKKMEMEARQADRQLQMELARMQMSQQAEMAKLQAETARASALAQAEATKAAAVAQTEIARASSDSNKLLLEAMLKKPAIDPAIMEMMGKNDTSQLLAAMSSVLSNTTSQQLSMMGAMMDMGFGPQKESAPKPVKNNAVLDFAKTVAQAFLVNKAPSGPAFQPQPQTQALPAQPGQPQPAQAAQAAAPGQAQPQGKPVNEMSVYEQVADAIRNRKADAKSIAEVVVRNWQDPSIQGAFTQAEGDLRVLLDNALGDWLDDHGNRVFGSEVIKQVLEQGITAGLVPETLKSMIPEMVKSFVESEAPKT